VALCGVRQIFLQGKVGSNPREASTPTCIEWCGWPASRTLPFGEVGVEG